MKSFCQYTHKRFFFLVAVMGLFMLSSGGCFSANYNTFSAWTTLEHGAEGSNPSLLVIRGKIWYYGYGDAAGNVIIQLQYTDAHPFFEGLAAVKRGGKYGYINEKGETVIPFQYYQALDFHNGRAFVGTELLPGNSLPYQKICIIDKTGTILRETDYWQISDYSDGFTLVQKMDGAYIYLDQDYEETSLPVDGLQFGFYQNGFKEGFRLYEKNGKRLGYMDKSGVSLPSDFPQAFNFSDGLAAVMPDEEAGLWGYIDKTGKYSIQARYKSAYSFGEGMACVITTDGKPMTINKAGEKICDMPDEVTVAGSFSEGLCAVGAYKDNPRPKPPPPMTYEEKIIKWGFMDTAGRIVIDYQFDFVTPFKSGTAQVCMDGKIGYIDKTGKYIWEPK